MQRQLSRRPRALCPRNPWLHTWTPAPPQMGRRISGPHRASLAGVHAQTNPPWRGFFAGSKRERSAISTTKAKYGCSM